MGLKVLESEWTLSHKYSAIMVKMSVESVQTEH